MIDLLIDEGLKLVFALVTPYLLFLVAQGLRKFNEKLNLQNDAERQAKLEAFARLAIQNAEEWAAARLKAKLKTTAKDKLGQATVVLQKNMPGLSAGEAATIIQAKLPELGLGASSGFPPEIQ